MVALAFEPALAEEARRRQETAAREAIKKQARDERGRVQAGTAPPGAEPDAPKPEVRAADEAARLTGSSTRSVQRAKRVKEKAPILANRVERGEVRSGPRSNPALATLDASRRHRRRSAGVEAAPGAAGRRRAENEGPLGAGRPCIVPPGHGEGSAR